MRRYFAMRGFAAPNYATRLTTPSPTNSRPVFQSAIRFVLLFVLLPFVRSRIAIDIPFQPISISDYHFFRFEVPLTTVTRFVFVFFLEKDFV